MLPLPSTSGAPLGRVSQLLSVIKKVQLGMGETVLSIESTGFQRMVARNASLQKRARLQTRSEPSVALLLRLEAAEKLALGSGTYVESAAARERPALRVGADPAVVEQSRTVGDAIRSPASQAGLRPVVEDVHRAAQLLVLDMRRRLYTVRSRIGVVLRFKARCEWHDRERLRRLADEAAAQGRKPEHALRDEFTLYLFDQGLNPLAEAVLGTSSAPTCSTPPRAHRFTSRPKQYRKVCLLAIKTELRSAFRQALDTIGNLPAAATRG